MRADEIRRSQRRQPFVPFTLHLADGREFLVKHPEFMLVSVNDRTVVIDDVDGGIEIIDPLMVTSLTVSANGAPLREN